MVDKIKDIYGKILSKVKGTPIPQILIMGSLWELLLGIICMSVSDNIMVKILGMPAFIIGLILTLCGVIVIGFVVLYKLAGKIKRFINKAEYSVKNERKRINRIKTNNKDNKKIRIGFYCDGGQFWSTFCDLYKLVCEDDRFEAVVVAAPETYKNEIYHYKAIDFLEEKKIPYVRAYENGKWINFKDLKIDYFFYNRHYLSRQSKHTSFRVARRYSKICYIPYAICPQVGAVQDTLCRFEELRGFDYMFSENRMMTGIYTKYKNEYENVITRIETVGSPKFAYAVANADKKVCHDKKYRQSVLYTPRWSFSECTNSFFDLKDYFFELVTKNKDIEYIFRPHPLMEQAVNEKFGQEFWEDFIKEFEKYDNAWVDTEVDYMQSFSRASVLVSDISTMMFEFSVTEKPVIYMYKMNKLNEFGKEASKGYYYCYDVDDVDKTLKMLREGNDKYRETRKEISRRLYSNDGINPAGQIRDILLEDYGIK